jgi:hypothetical protein
MVNESAFGTLSRLSATSLGIFRGRDASSLGVSRKQLVSLVAAGVIERALPDTYRMTAVAPSNEQSLRAALLWAGTTAAAAGRSAGEVYRLEGVRAQMPEIVVTPQTRVRSDLVVVHRASGHEALRVRRRNGLRMTGVEPTMVALAQALDAERFEIACEDARRRQLTTVSALRTYLNRFPGRPGAAALRQLLDELDPVHASRSTLEVKTRRLLVAHGLSDFTREFPLAWNGRRYRIVFATWEKVTGRPRELLAELTTTLAA